MAYTPKNGRGGLFFNDKREGKQPHLRGNVRINDQDYWLSAWIEETQDSVLTKADKINLMQILQNVRLSLSAQAKEVQQESRADTPEESEDLPF